MSGASHEGPGHFLRALLIATPLGLLGFAVLALLSGAPVNSSAAASIWIAGALFAAAALLGAFATLLDGVAGLNPRNLAWIYPLAFVVAMFAWVLGIVFIIALFIAMIFGGGADPGPGQGMDGYGDLRPKNRAKR